MTVSVAIQAHPSRAEMAAELAACVGGAEIVLDPEPNSELRSPWRTYRAALERTPPDASSRLVLQDDVLVCDHFLEGVERAVAARPGRVLCLFVAGNPPNHERTVYRTLERREAWAELDLRTWIPVVATLWPAALIGPLLDFDAGKRERLLWPPGFVADDEIAGRFLQARGEHALALVPSIVEHPDTVPSVMNGHRRGGDGHDLGRRAAVFVSDLGLCDARLLDYESGAGG